MIDRYVQVPIKKETQIKFKNMKSGMTYTDFLEKLMVRNPDDPLIFCKHCGSPVI